MGLLSFMCRLRAREAFDRSEQTGEPTNVDQDAKNEVLSEELLRHVAGGPDKTAQQKKARRPPR
jgi:hypothetical protein